MPKLILAAYMSSVNGSALIVHVIGSGAALNARPIPIPDSDKVARGLALI
jgi:hypothetical protein